MKNPCVLRLAARAALVVSFTVGFAAAGSANSTGRIGASGKDGVFCKNCHVGGTAPTVAFDGPASMGVGSTATFRFTVTSHATDQIAAGLDVAVSGGTLGLVTGQGTRLLSNEVTHSSPKGNDANGEAAFDFTWQAPASAGIYTLYGAGGSVNLDGKSLGDAAARTTHEVFVGVATPTPTNTPQPASPTPSATPTATATGTPNDTTCVGDCETPGEVTLGDLITGVNMALGAPLSACPAFDVIVDQEVTIDEILQAVNSALSTCPA